jgi:hypothetical protein
MHCREQQVTPEFGYYHSVFLIVTIKLPLASCTVVILWFYIGIFVLSFPAFLHLFDSWQVDKGEAYDEMPGLKTWHAMCD